MSDWYYAVNNEQKGPINESELKTDFAQNKLPADTLVWKEGMDNWSPANTVSAFSFRPPPIPAKVQPPAASAPAPAAPATTKSSTPAPSSQTKAAAAPAPSTPVNNPDSTKPVELSDILKKPEPLEVDPADAEANKIQGIIAYVGPLFLVPLVTVKDSPYAKYHGNQGFTLCILWVVVAVVVTVLDSIFHMVKIYALDWIFGLLYLLPLGLAIFGIVNAGFGKCVPLPGIGGVKLVK